MAIYNGTNGNDNFFPLPSQFNTPFIAYGNGGNDILDFRKSTADNDIVGGTSADNTTGGSDTIYGGSGNDYIVGGSTGSLLIAGTGSTTLMGGAGNDTLNAGPGNDELDAGAGKNTINAGAGNDLIYVGDNSTDTINNVGAGAVSLFIAAGATANVSLAGNWTPNNQTSNSGSANIYTNGKNVDLSAITGVNGWSITDGAVNATFAAGGLSSTPSTIIGSNANDTIISGIGGDVIYGGNGGHNTFVNNGLANDIEGRNGGNNTIVGFYSDSANLGAHGDTINGGTGGNNTLQVNPTDLSSPLPNGFYGLISNIQNITTTNAATTVDLTNQTAAYNVTGGNGQNTLISGNGNDSLTGGVGVDKFIISGTGTETINNLGQGADILNVSNAAAIVNATLAGNWIAQKDSYNDGVTTLYDQGYTLDLSRIISGHGFDIVNTGAGASITGSQYADSITGGAGNDSIYGFNNQDTVNGGGGVNTLELKGNELATPVAAGQITNIQNIVLNGAGQVDITNLTGVSVTGSSGQDTLIASTGSNTLTGGLGADLFEIKGGNQVITDFGTGADNLQVTGGTINITLTSAFTAAPSTSNTGGTVNLSTNGLAVDLRKAGGAAGFGFDVTNTGGADTIYASKFADTINAGTGNDVLYGGGGNDVLVAGKGSDTLVAAATGHDAFSFAAGDGGQTMSTREFISGFNKANDSIVYTTADLKIGGTATTTAGVTINQTTGQATFSAHVGGDLTGALNAIASNFASNGDAAGEFAFFKLGNGGDEYLVISDGAGAGSTANDVVIKLIGISSVNSVAINHGVLTIG